MNQDDHKLYNILCNVKNNLQQHFYDYQNGINPVICTEDALRLLVKYKPTTIEDMSNISGIGDNFIVPRPLSKSTHYYKLNHRIPNGTYGGVRGKSIYYFSKKFSLLDLFEFKKIKLVI